MLPWLNDSKEMYFVVDNMQYLGTVRKAVALDDRYRTFKYFFSLQKQEQPKSWNSRLNLL